MTIGGVGAVAARREPPGDPRDRLLLAAAVVVGLSVGNHSLTLLLGAADRPVRPGGRARHPPAAAVHRRHRRGVRDPDGPRPVRDDPAGRLVPGAVRLRRPEHLERASGTSTLGAQFHGWLTDPFGDVAAAARRPRWRSPSASSAPLRAPDRRRVRRDRRPPAAVRAPERDDARRSPASSTRVYPNGAIDRYYIGPGADRLDLAGDPRRPRSMDSAAGSSAGAGRRTGGGLAAGSRRLLRPLGLVLVAARSSSCRPSSPSRPGRARTDRPDRRPGGPGLDRRGPRRPGARRRRRVVVELLDTALVCHDRRWHGAPDICDHR